MSGQAGPVDYLSSHVGRSYGRAELLGIEKADGVDLVARIE